MAMETARGASEITTQGVLGRSPRRGTWRRAQTAVERLRCFVPQSGSTPEIQKLGQPAASEGAAQLEARKSGQLFTSLIAGRAPAERNGSEAKMVKQPFSSG